MKEPRAEEHFLCPLARSCRSCPQNKNLSRTEEGVMFCWQAGFLANLSTHCGMTGVIVWDPVYVVVSETTQGNRRKSLLFYLEELRRRQMTAFQSKGNRESSCESGQIVSLKLIAALGRSVLVPSDGSSRRQRGVRPPSNPKPEALHPELSTLNQVRPLLPRLRLSDCGLHVHDGHERHHERALPPEVAQPLNSKTQNPEVFLFQGGEVTALVPEWE